MTDLEFADWLISPNAARCLLVEAVALVDGVATTFYLSTTGYVTGPGDTPASTAYQPVIMGGIKFSEKLELDSAGLTYTDIELQNSAGELDTWLDYIWVNKPFKVFFGDASWPRSDFKPVMAGITEDLDSRSRTRLNLKVRDMLERLNTPVSDVVLGGTTESADELIPLVFGEVHNMTPLLIDPSLHTYQVHIGRVQRIIEARDNGVPITVVADTVEGKFMLSGTPAGTITASVQGDAQPDWNITVASIIRRLATGYGQPAMRFTADEIDSGNFDAFDAAHPQPVGTCCTDKQNVLEKCRELANSIGAQLTAGRLGKLRLVQLQFPGMGTPVKIGPGDMVDQTLTIVERHPVIAAVKLAYCKNWTVQSGLETGILEEHKKRFAVEWDTVRAKYTEVAEAYHLHTEPEQRETMLLRRIEAEPEAWRLLDMFSVPRTTFRFEGLAQLLPVDLTQPSPITLGQAVLLHHPRFNLAEGEGKPGVIVGLVPDYLKGRVTVEVMV